MNRLFRWQILVPPLLLVTVALLAVQYVFGLAARSIAVRSGEAAVGAQVEVAHARVSLLDRQLVLGDLRFADPRQPLQNLVEADRCELNFAAEALFRKQALVERGTITGLRFGTPRDTSGALVDASPGPPRPSPNWFSDGAAELGREWFARLDERFQGDLVNQLASVERTKELCARWPEQSAALQRRAEELQRRATQLQASLRAAQSNPLRHVDVLSSLPEESAALEQESAQFGAELKKLPEMLEADRRAIVAARCQDEQSLRDRLHLEPIDASVLTAYLLREQVAQSLDQVIGWMRCARQIVPAQSAPRRGTKRGEQVLFVGCRPAPSFVIRTLRLQGTARVSGQPVELRGTLTDFTATPSLHPQPMRVRLVTTGPLPLELHATIDRTGPVARDELFVDCHGLVLPKLNLGRVDQLQLAVAPSVGSLSISVIVEGDKLTGDIQLAQKQVRIVPELRGNLSDVPLSLAVANTLGDVNALATRCSLSGTLSEPKCTLWSNLGTAVAEAMERALQQAGDQHARTLLAEAQRQVDEHLAGLERKVADQQAELAAQLADVTGRLDTIASKQSASQRLSPEQLGRRFPTSSLLR